jgi:hypothetical protein
MRHASKHSRPRLEILEERWVPATVRQIASELLISHQTGILSVAVSATAGQVTVKDNGHAVTYNGVGSLISITGTNSNDSITFTGGAGFNGNLLINAGNGNDMVSVTGPLPGNATVLMGLGSADQLSLAGSIGGSLTYNHLAGGNSVTTTAATTIGGSASFTGLGALTLTNSLSVGGNLVLVGVPNNGTPLAVTSSGAGSLGVGTSLAVTGSTGGTNFSMTGTGALSVGGNASFNLGNGASTFNVSTTPASSVGGNLAVTGGSGVDTVTLGATLTVNGNAGITLGDGDNVLTGLSNAFTVAGDFTMTLGNGNNGTFTIGGIVAGNETLTVGNGIDKITVNNPSGGLFTFHAGNGPDPSLTLGTGAGQTWDVMLSFGTGINMLTLDGADTYSGTMMGSGGNDTLNQNGATLFDISLVDFPNPAPPGGPGGDKGPGGIDNNP